MTYNLLIKLDNSHISPLFIVDSHAYILPTLYPTGKGDRFIFTLCIAKYVTLYLLTTPATLLSF